MFVYFCLVCIFVVKEYDVYVYAIFSSHLSVVYRNWLTEMAGRDIWTRLRQLDAYPKTLEDFRIKTFSGATGELNRPCYSSDNAGEAIGKMRTCGPSTGKTRTIIADQGRV